MMRRTRTRTHILRRARRRRRRRRPVYLGTRVPDTRRPGLDSVAEVERIARAILEDYRRGRIDAKTANGRFALLCNWVISRASGLKGKRAKARQACRKYWERFRQLRAARARRAR